MLRPGPVLWHPPAQEPADHRHHRRGPRTCETGHGACTAAGRASELRARARQEGAQQSRLREGGGAARAPYPLTGLTYFYTRQLHVCISVYI